MYASLSLKINTKCPENIARELLPHRVERDSEGITVLQPATCTVLTQTVLMAEYSNVKAVIILHAWKFYFPFPSSFVFSPHFFRIFLLRSFTLARMRDFALVPLVRWNGFSLIVSQVIFGENSLVENLFAQLLDWSLWNEIYTRFGTTMIQLLLSNLFIRMAWHVRACWEHGSSIPRRSTRWSTAIEKSCMYVAADHVGITGIRRLLSNSV